MNAKHDKNVIYKICCLFLFIVLCTWFIPNYIRGIDVTDTCFSYAKYKYAFNSEQSMTKFSIIFTDLIGGVIYHILPSHQFLILNMTNAILYTISSLFIIFVLRNELPMPLLLFTAIISNFFSLTNMHTFNYNSTSIFVLIMALGTLFTAYKKNDNKLLMIAGFLCGLNIFFRLPNILQCIMALSILWYTTVCNKASIKDGIMNFFRFVIGAAAAAIIGCIISIIYCGPAEVISVLQSTANTFLGGSTASSHSSVSMLQTFKSHYIKSFEIWKTTIAVIIIVLICLLLAKRFLSKGTKSHIILNCICICLGIVTAAASLYKIKDMYMNYIFWIIIILFSMAISFWGMWYYRNKNSFISAACCINLLTLIVLPVGTDVGLLYYNYYIFVPMCIVLISLTHMDSTAKSRLTIGHSGCLIFSFLLFYAATGGYYYQTTYVYRDASYKLLKETVAIPELYGMRTSAERAEMIEQATSLLKPYANYELITLGDFNVLALTTDMNCFFSVPWPNLSSFSEETFISEIDDKLEQHIYPVILLAPTSSIINDGNCQYRSIVKYNKLLDVIKTYDYQTLYKSDALEIYVPDLHPDSGS